MASEAAKAVFADELPLLLAQGMGELPFPRTPKTAESQTWHRAPHAKTIRMYDENTDGGHGKPSVKKSASRSWDDHDLKNCTWQSLANENIRQRHGKSWVQVTSGWV